MPSWSKEEYANWIARKNKAGGELPHPKPKQVVRDEPLAAAQGKETSTGRTVVRIVSFRTRLCDTDNLCGGCKYAVDALRYNGLIPNDDPQSIELRVTQIKVKTRKQERTEIEIIYDNRATIR